MGVRQIADPRTRTEGRGSVGQINGERTRTGRRSPNSPQARARRSTDTAGTAHRTTRAGAQSADGSTGLLGRVAGRRGPGRRPGPPARIVEWSMSPAGADECTGRIAQGLSRPRARFWGWPDTEWPFKRNTGRAHARPILSRADPEGPKRVAWREVRGLSTARRKQAAARGAHVGGQSEDRGDGQRPEGEVGEQAHGPAFGNRPDCSPAGI